MTTYEEFARQLAKRAEQPLFFAEAQKLGKNRFSDVGEIPRSGDPALAMRETTTALHRTREPFHFGRLVFYAGYLVELGAPPRDVALLVARRLPEFVTTAALAARNQPDEQDIMKLATAAAPQFPDAAAAILVLELALTGAMTLFCRDREALRLARRSPELRESARGLGGNVIVAYFLSELLRSSDKQRIVVLIPRSRRGFSVIADGVRNGFHLFVLLEGALLGTDGRGPVTGPPLPPDDVEIARGTKPLSGEKVMRAHFDYFNWSAWDGSGWLADAPTRWIWGELPLGAIPQLHEQTVVLLDSPNYKRSWDARLACALHPDQHPNVTIEQELSEPQVRQWLEAIAAAPAATRSSLRYAGVEMG